MAMKLFSMILYLTTLQPKLVAVRSFSSRFASSSSSRAAAAATATVGSSRMTASRHCMTSSSSSSSSSRFYDEELPSFTTRPLCTDEQVVQNILQRIRYCNNMPDDVHFLEFKVNHISLGKVRPKIAELLCSIHDDDEPIFQVVVQDDASYLTLTPYAGTTYESRTAAVATVMEQLRDRGIVRGWRDELYPITQSFYDKPVFGMERAAVPLLGTLEYGVHVNGLVRNNNNNNSNDSNSGILMWMARRAPDKSKYPGMLDHIAAGGQPVGLSLAENVVKECYEEAGIPEELTQQNIRSAGAISYEVYIPEKDTVQRAVLFNYDLYLPPDFQPKPMDGEVEEFFLWTIDDLLESMAPDYPDPIKPNCYIVIIDFLLRHGYISPDVPGYLDILRELRSGDCK